MSIIGKALRGCRKSLRMTLPEMATKLNVSTTTIVNYETGKRLPDVDFLIDLSSVSEQDILYWLGLRIQSSHSVLANEAKAVLDNAAASSIRQGGQSLVGLPLYQINDLANPPENSAHGNAVDEIPQFSRAWLERELSATPADLCLVPIEDDSMTPTLRRGDTILLDRRFEKAEREGIYILHMNGVPLVKRLQILPDETIKVVSDNTAYEPFTITQSDFGSRNISILGKVVWVIWSGRRV